MCAGACPFWDTHTTLPPDLAPSPLTGLFRAAIAFDATTLRPCGRFARRRSKFCDDVQRAGVRPDIFERVLAHAIKGVEGVYDRYGYLPEKLDALTKLDAIVDRILRTIDW
jgi:hypothetical protein